MSNIKMFRTGTTKGPEYIDSFNSPPLQISINLWDGTYQGVLRFDGGIISSVEGISIPSLKKEFIKDIKDKAILVSEDTDNLRRSLKSYSQARASLTTLKSDFASHPLFAFSNADVETLHTHAFALTKLVKALFDAQHWVEQLR